MKREPKKRGGVLSRDVRFVVALGTRLAAMTLAACALAPTAPSRNPAPAIDAFVAAERERQRIPGVAVAVIHKGKIVRAAGYGLANVEHQEPVRAETIFQSGSVGK